MKHLILLFSALCLCGCGLVGKLDAVSNMELSGASYRACLAEHKHDAAACEDRHIAYQTDLAEAQKTRGILTNWRRL
ncbi:MAG TPA: hypothetical protein VNH44_00135 [Micropepsaceae bacterium]|nr:hypothetical protein [Micropepsaceae bacterium]